MKLTIFLKLTFFYHQYPHNLYETATVVEWLLQDPKHSHRTEQHPARLPRTAVPSTICAMSTQVPQTLTWPARIFLRQNSLFLMLKKMWRHTYGLWMTTIAGASCVQLPWDQIQKAVQPDDQDLICCFK